MNITQRQRKFIKSHRGRMTAHQMAADLKITSSVVESVLREMEPSVKPTRDWWAYGILAATVLITFSFSITGEFVSDDIPVIRDSRIIGVAQTFGTHPLNGLRNFFYYLIYHVAGREPIAYHLLNMFFHLGAVCLLFYIVKSLHSRRAAFMAALLFAVHPIIVEPVSWISGGPYPQYTAFLLLSLAFLIRSVRANRTSYYWYSLLAFALAMMSSEKAIVYPFILIPFAYAYPDLKLRWKQILPYFLLMPVWLGYNLTFLSGRMKIHTQNFGETGYINNPFLLVAVGVTSYLSLIIWPQNLSIYHSDFYLSPWFYTIMVSGLVAYLAVTIYAAVKQRAVFFWLCVFLISLGVVLTPLKISWIVAERYAYFGMAGLAAAVGIVADRLAERKRVTSWVYTIFGIVIVALWIRSVLRVMDWQSQDSIWIATARTTPDNPVSHVNMGDVYRRHGDYQRAAAEFQTAVALNPEYMEGYYNLGDIYRETGHYDQAQTNYEKALSLNGGVWQIYQSLGAVHYLKHEFPVALTYTQKSIQLNGSNADLYFNLGLIFMEMHQKQAALDAFSTALKIDPTHTKSQQGILKVKSML